MSIYHLRDCPHFLRCPYDPGSLLASFRNSLSFEGLTLPFEAARSEVTRAPGKHTNTSVRADCSQRPCISWSNSGPAPPRARRGGAGWSLRAPGTRPSAPPGPSAARPRRHGEAAASREGPGRRSARPAASPWGQVCASGNPG